MNVTKYSSRSRHRSRPLVRSLPLHFGTTTNPMFCSTQHFSCADVVRTGGPDAASGQLRGARRARRRRAARGTRERPTAVRAARDEAAIASQSGARADRVAAADRLVLREQLPAHRTHRQRELVSALLSALLAITVLIAHVYNHINRTTCAICITICIPEP